MGDLSLFIGDVGKAFKILLIIIVLDFLTGVTKAIKEKNLKSSEALFGILKKCGYIVLVAVANLLDILFNSNGELKLMCIVFLIGVDGISILENLAIIGVPIPKRIKSVLGSIKETITNEDENDKVFDDLKDTEISDEFYKEVNRVINDDTFIINEESHDK